MAFSETGTLPVARTTVRAVSIETLIRDRPEKTVDVEWMLGRFHMRNGWPEDFRVPLFERIQGC